MYKQHVTETFGNLFLKYTINKYHFHWHFTSAAYIQMIFRLDFIMELEICPWDTDAPLMQNLHIFTKPKKTNFYEQRAITLEGMV